VSYHYFRCASSRRLLRHDDRAGGGEHAAEAVADRDLGVRDLRGGGAAYLADALLQRVPAVHTGMNIGKAAATDVERDPRAGGPAGRPRDAGTVLRSAMKAPASPRGIKPRFLKL
jgi:hypothetical protein